MIALISAAVIVGWWMSHRETKQISVADDLQTQVLSYRLSPLGKTPDWKALDVYQSTLTKDQFLGDLTRYFTCSDEWKKFIEVRDDFALISEAASCIERRYRLNFAALGQEKKTSRYWRKKEELANAETPLRGLHVAIDAGHLGGEWAQMEERWFRIDDGRPVTEGDMTLYVARLLQPMLEKKGAMVSLVRKDTEPLTKDRPEQLMALAREENPSLANPFYLNKAAESLFYRTSEIRARAAYVNEVLKPDLVLCLHFNAVAWGDPANPTLVDENHLHI